MSFIKSLENRRTIYALGRNVQDEAKVIESISTKKNKVFKFRKNLYLYQ